jgi:CRISPR system Cascade subunit CasD
MTADSALTLLLAGPLQAWGESSRHMTRSTLAHPSKSGVTGLLAAALGMGRGDERIRELAALRFGVRIDQPGQLLTDYHTVSGASQSPLDPEKQRLPTADGGTLQPAKSIKVTYRHYLADARFVAALQGDPDLLTGAWDALARPRYPLYLGRRSCPPANRIRLRLWHAATIEEALALTPWAAAEHVTRRYNEPEIDLRVIIDDPSGGETFHDFPLPSSPFRLAFAARTARHTAVRIRVSGGTTADHDASIPASQTDHDPFDLLPGV